MNRDHLQKSVGFGLSQTLLTDRRDVAVEPYDLKSTFVELPVAADITFHT